MIKHGHNNSMEILSMNGICIQFIPHLWAEKWGVWTKRKSGVPRIYTNPGNWTWSRHDWLIYTRYVPTISSAQGAEDFQGHYRNENDLFLALMKIEVDIRKPIRFLQIECWESGRNVEKHLDSSLGVIGAPRAEPCGPSYISTGSYLNNTLGASSLFCWSLISEC